MNSGSLQGLFWVLIQAPPSQPRNASSNCRSSRETSPTCLPQASQRGGGGGNAVTAARASSHSCSQYMGGPSTWGWGVEARGCLLNKREQARSTIHSIKSVPGAFSRLPTPTLTTLMGKSEHRVSSIALNPAGSYYFALHTASARTLDQPLNASHILSCRNCLLFDFISTPPFIPNGISKQLLFYFI